MNNSTNIQFDFVPDMVYSYKFCLCELCKVAKSKDEKFDNSNCPHCKLAGKVCMWSSGVKVTRALNGDRIGEENGNTI